MEWFHGRGRLIRFKIEGESNLILPHYSTCLEIILGVWDSFPEGNCTRASSHPVKLWEMCTVLPLLILLCAIRGLFVPELLGKPVGVLFWHKICKMRNGPLWVRYVGFENSHRDLGSNSVSGGKNRGKHMVTF